MSLRTRVIGRIEAPASLGRILDEVRTVVRTGSATSSAADTAAASSGPRIQAPTRSPASRRSGLTPRTDHEDHLGLRFPANRARSQGCPDRRCLRRTARRFSRGRASRPRGPPPPCERSPAGAPLQRSAHRGTRGDTGVARRARSLDRDGDRVRGVQTSRGVFRRAVAVRDDVGLTPAPAGDEPAMRGTACAPAAVTRRSRPPLAHEPRGLASRCGGAGAGERSRRPARQARR